MTPILVPTLDELAVEFERAVATERAANIAAIAAGEDLPSGEVYGAAHASLYSVVGQIAELQAQTFAHVRLKAMALEAINFADAPEPKQTDERLAFQIVKALLLGLPEVGGQ